ncbi:MAG: glycosyltransferase [Candidatus Omnitrophica bacterium]|nr:glycosyltransferase [Candidatus Omnitrophota bacterium]
MKKALRIFIGWDSREEVAYDVCLASLRRYSSRPLDVTPLKQEELRHGGLYARSKDPLASTEFTYTRFLTPFLADYRGWALFVDCDFLFTADVAELFAMADPRCAVMCVQHDHRPPERTKMDGALQTVYPRKNWSSLVLWNCAYPSNGVLTPEAVNRETGAFLHRFQWLKDSEIGALPETWNWLEGWSRAVPDEIPKAIHFTRGGPWFDKWKHVKFGELWQAEYNHLLQKKASVTIYDNCSN